MAPTLVPDVSDNTSAMERVNWTDATAALNATTAAEVTPVPTTAEAEMTWDDATWILTSSFIIFTMQSGTRSFRSGTSGDVLLLRHFR